MEGGPGKGFTKLWIRTELKQYTHQQNNTSKSIGEIGKFSWCSQNQNSCPETFACFPAYQHGRKSTAD